jgi:phage recombination protein Bet
LNDVEFWLFVAMGKQTGCNPYLREIWAVKYNNQCNIFVGRDWYRKSAQACDDYDYHYSNAIYSNDTFNIPKWDISKIEHIFDLKKRWELVMAYCIVKRKNASKPVINFVNFNEYYWWNKIVIDWQITDKIKQTSKWPAKPTLWDTKPVTMLCKVAEAQWLRATFQELFAWTYDESEDWNVKQETQNQLIQAPEITKNENEREKLYEDFSDKLTLCKNLEELREVFFQICKNKNNLGDEKYKALEEIKNDIKEKMKEITPEEAQKIFNWEVEDINS